MSKLTKQQRRQRRKIVKAEKRKKKNDKPKPWVPVKMKMFEFLNPLPPEVPREERLKIIRSIGSKAKKDFDEKYPKIESWFKKYDSLYLLSFCATYFATSPEGIDLEAVGKVEFFPHYIEIMQAFALSQERNYSLSPLFKDAAVLKREMKEIGDLMGLRMVNIPEELETNEEISSYELRMEMMANTTAVRNWAYFHQMKRVVFDLARIINDDFKKVFGVGCLSIMELLFKLTEERNDLLNEHIDKVRRCIKKSDYKDIIKTYYEEILFNKLVDPEEIEKLWESVGKNKKHLISMLICHSDLRLDDVYSFTLDHAKSIFGETTTDDALMAILRKLSFNFGDLSNFNKEYIILDNPVHRKPFIELENQVFYSAVWSIIPHLALDILENLVWENQDLREKYSDIKAQYLEDELEKTFKYHFPNGSVYRGSIWKNGILGKEYENDLVIIIDSFAIIVEAKSRRLSDPAKRGAPDRLFETLKELIEEPSEQALRFIDYLRSNNKVHTLRDKHGATNTIDSSKIKYYIPLGVTFSHLGMIGSNLKKLINAKIVSKPLEELAPSINFTDLEAIFELLPLEAEKVHYLARRREFEAHLEYEGDELDLLAFYLENGFNIGLTEYEKSHVFFLGTKSKELDPYFIGTNEGRKVARPELAMTQWWRDLLATMATRKIEGWVETSFVLLNTTKEDQQEFEKAIGELVNRIQAHQVEKPHNWVVFKTGPERRRYVIIGYPYATSDKDLRNAIMSEALDNPDTDKTRGVVVIGINIDSPNYPYSVLSRRLSTNLFDTLTL